MARFHLLVTDSRAPMAKDSAAERCAADRHPEDIRLQSYQLGGKTRQAFELAVRKTHLDHEVLAFHVAELVQALEKRVYVGESAKRFWRYERKHSNPV